MTLGIVNIISCMTSKLPILKKNLLYDNRITCRQICTINIKQISMHLFTMCSFINNLFTATGNNNRIGNRNVHFKLAIVVFQINSISFIESEEFRETSIV